MENTDKLLSITLDDEFNNLIQPLSGLDYHRLGMQIKSAGYAVIRTWDNILVSDLHIYKICREFNIPCDTEEKDFQNRNEAISFVCSEQLMRDDHTNEYIKYLIGKEYLAMVKCSNSIKVPKLSIAMRLGTRLNISPATVQKYGLYADSLDRVFAVQPDIVQDILMGLLRISHENTVELSRLPKEELSALSQIVNENQSMHLSYADIRHEIRWKNYTASTTKPKQVPDPGKSPGIRRIPQYDPDAQISSLALTIPSWISSIERAMNQTNFPETTHEARNRLNGQLASLNKALITILKAMEESHNG